MKNSKLLINILIALLVLAGLFVAYSYFFGGEDEASNVGVQVVGNLADQANTGRAAEFVVLLESLRNVDFQSDIFSNPVFTSGLDDFTTVLPDRPTGRGNPFSPLGN